MLLLVVIIIMIKISAVKGAIEQLKSPKDAVILVIGMKLKHNFPIRADKNCFTELL